MFMPQSPDIGQNSYGGISDFQISGQTCHNSNTSDDIDKKLGSVTKPDKRIWRWRRVGKLTSLFFFQFKTNLEQLRSRIPFILQKPKTELKNLSYISHTIALSKGTILVKKHWLFKKMLTSAKLRESWY